jgi:Xaa-Pro aminopeptidase
MHSKKDGEFMIEIPPSLLLERNRQLQEKAKETGLDGLMIFSQAARMMGATSTHGYLRYLLDWTSWGSPSLYFLPVEGNPTLVVPIPGEVEHAREKVPWIQDIRFCNVNDYGKLTCKLLSDRRTTGRIGMLGTQELSCSMVKDLSEHKHEWNFEPAEHLIDQHRMVKDKTGITLMREAAAVCDTMFETLGNCLKEPGTPAWKLQVEIEHAGRKAGAEIAWTWLASGLNPDRPRVGPQENARSIQQGDCVVAAIILIYQGYYGHAIRMFSMGAPSREQLQVWECVHHAQQNAAKMLKPGFGISAPNLAAEKTLFDHFPEAQAMDKIRFRPCHFIGLDYAEFPTGEIMSLSSQPDQSNIHERALESGMTMEIHPNLRPPGLGFGALGDIYLITSEGAECLTKYPHDICIIESG